MGIKPKENEESMLKSLVSQYKPGTPEYVIAHAVYQKSHGRGLSMTFRNIRNPRKAFEAAVAAIITRDAMDFDPYAMAEKIVGRGTTDTDLLGLRLLVTSNRIKNDLLKKADDTGYSNELSNYIRIVREEGFELVLETPFVGKSWSGEEPPMEKHFVFFHPQEGILLSFDTFGGKSVNGGKFYYNWAPNMVGNSHDYTSSGSWVEYPTLWEGDHDCREGFRLNLCNLRANGKFVTPWVKSPFIWLLHHMDTENPNYNYKSINDSRVARLPEYVQRAIASQE